MEESWLILGVFFSSFFSNLVSHWEHFKRAALTPWLDSLDHKFTQFPDHMNQIVTCTLTLAYMVGPWFMLIAELHERIPNLQSYGSHLHTHILKNKRVHE